MAFIQVLVEDSMSLPHQYLQANNACNWNLADYCTLGIFNFTAVTCSIT